MIGFSRSARPLPPSFGGCRKPAERIGSVLAVVPGGRQLVAGTRSVAVRCGWLGALLTLMPACSCFATGVLGELLTRVYHEPQGRKKKKKTPVLF